MFKEEGNVRGNFDEFRDVSERKVECKVITRVSGNGYAFSFFLFFNPIIETEFLSREGD